MANIARDYGPLIRLPCIYLERHSAFITNDGQSRATVLLRFACELNTSLLELRCSSVVRFQVSASGAARLWLDGPARRPPIGQVGAMLGLWAAAWLERGRKGLRSESCRCFRAGMGGRLCGGMRAGRGVQAP